MDNNLAEKLNEYLDEVVRSEFEERFVIDDDKKADWAVRKIARYQHNIDAARALVEEQITRLNDWQDQVIAENQGQIEFFLALLRPYAEAKVAGGKSKTVSLPSGSISLRASSPAFLIGNDQVKADSPQLVEHVKKFAPDLLKIKETADWAELKKRLIVMMDGQVISPDGDVLVFMRGEIRPDTISVKERK